MGENDYSRLTSTSAIAWNRAASISQIMALAYAGITPHIHEIHRVGLSNSDSLPAIFVKIGLLRFLKFYILDLRKSF